MRAIANLLGRRTSVGCSLLSRVIFCGLLLVLTNGFVPTRQLFVQNHIIIRIVNSNNNYRNFVRSNPIYYSNNDTAVVIKVHAPQNRFERTAVTKPDLDELCILSIDNKQYNLTAWAKAHPGGVKILQKFHNKDASKAFHNAGHSKAAYEMLKDFEIEDEDGMTSKFEQLHNVQRTIENDTNQPLQNVPRWRRKLFTKEDPIGIHKYLGLFCLLNYIFRFGQMYFGDPSAGLGTRLGKGPSWISFLCLIPHGLLSVSSLIFHTVPKERVVGKPMIWQEFRAHNIVFGLRSVIAAMVCSLGIRYAHIPGTRRIVVWTSSLLCLGTLIAADIATNKLRPNQMESTTATMPYWDGCSIETQKKFKMFYAYCQFMATFGCLMVTNPAFPLSVLLAIQIASLLMTLVRKGLLTAKGYHIGYTASLIAPYLVASRSILYAKSWDLPIIFGVASGMFMLRRMGVSKYLLWLPVIAARIVVGDSFLCYTVW